MLQLAGYIELTEELDNPSKLMFTVLRDQLYNFRMHNAAADQLIEVLLRSYTGVFADMVHINEEVIGQRLGWTRQKVYDQLCFLAQNGIVKYVPFKKTPLLIYTQPRVDSARIVLPKQVYEERRERYVRRIKAVLRYANETQLCRSQLLLDYFGETGSHRCGQCDTCIAQRANKLNAQRFAELERHITAELEANPQSIQALVQKIDGAENDVVQAVRHLLDQQKLEQNAQMKLSVKH